MSTIPGSPIGGQIVLDVAADKLTVPTTWNGWSHGFAGPVYATASPATVPGERILTLPPGTTAFYVYANQNAFLTTQTITATTNTGTTSGPIAIQALVGTANGYGFYTTLPGETIQSITITTSDTSGFGFGEFGAGPVFRTSVPTLGTGSMLALMALCLATGLTLVRRRT